MIHWPLLGKKISDWYCYWGHRLTDANLAPPLWHIRSHDSSQPHTRLPINRSCHADHKISFGIFEVGQTLTNLNRLIL